ncbi:ribonuclease H-like domain-containing protein [Tanacetum coccineum]
MHLVPSSIFGPPLIGLHRPIMAITTIGGPNSQPTYHRNPSVNPSHPTMGVHIGPTPAHYASQATYLPNAFSIMTLQDPTWHIDAGASSHLNFNASNLSTIFDKRLCPSVHVGDDNSIPVTNIGHSIISSIHRPLHLHNLFCEGFPDSSYPPSIDSSGESLSSYQSPFQLPIPLSSAQVLPRGINASVIRVMKCYAPLCLHKFHADGSLSRYKARLVANGSIQQLGVGFDKTFSPVVKPATIRTVLSLVVSHQWPIHQLDVKNDFLNDDLSETVYMHQPLGFVDSRYPHHVFLLQRSLYGLKQAPRAWFQHFASYATRVGFYHSRCDSSLFIYRHGSQVMSHKLGFIIVDVILLCLSIDRVLMSLIYVDDIILITSSSVLLQHIIDSLHNEFDMTDLGALNYFLGISATRTLIESKLGPKCGPVQDPTLYRSLAGGYGILHLHGAVDFGLQLYISATTSLVGYTDVDWACCPSTRSVANVIAETAWLHNLLRELHSPLSTVTLVYCDNVSDVYMSANPVQHQRTKHIEIDIHFVRDMVIAGQVRVLHVPSH